MHVYLTVYEQNYELRNVFWEKKPGELSSGLETGPLLDRREGSTRGLSCVINIILILYIILLILFLFLVGGQASTQPFLVSKIHSLLFNAGRNRAFSLTQPGSGTLFR
jgi:hypothetical protein